MSASKRPTLSTVHAIFRGLQADLKEHIKSLPSTCSPELKKSLVDAHQKLASYYWCFDNESPFYIWAAREPLSFSH